MIIYFYDIIIYIYIYIFFFLYILLYYYPLSILIHYPRGVHADNNLVDKITKHHYFSIRTDNFVTTKLIEITGDVISMMKSTFSKYEVLE